MNIKQLAPGQLFYAFISFKGVNISNLNPSQRTFVRCANPCILLTNWDGTPVFITSPNLPEVFDGKSPQGYGVVRKIKAFRKWFFL